MDYLDCILHLDNEQQAALYIGTQRYDSRTQLTAELRESLKQFADDAVQYGESLFTALFPLGSMLDTGLRNALNQAQEKKLRLRLDIPETAPDELHRLNWELLYNQNAPTGAEFLTRSANIIFSRQRNVSGITPKNTDSKQIKMLVIISSPNNLDPEIYQPLNRAEIEQQFKAWLDPLKAKSRLSGYDFLPAPVTREAIGDALNSGAYQAVQFYGHGYKVAAANETGLVLENKNGTAAFVKEAECLDTFKTQAPPQSLVLLTACHSGAATRATDAFSGLALGLVRQNHQAVIAFKQAVRIETADAFLKYFYKGLLYTDGVLDAAFNQAQAQVARTDDAEWFLPTLYMRTPDGRLWAEEPLKHTGPSPSPHPQTSGLSEQILRYFRKGKVVPIIGPGIWKGNADVPDLFPTHAETASFLALTLHEDPTFTETKRHYQNSDLPHIARLYGIAKESDYAPHEDVVALYRNELCKRFGGTDSGLAEQPLSTVVSELAPERFKQDPSEPHKLLARLMRLGCKTFITTNCDSFLYEALCREAKAQNKSVEPRLRCYWFTEETSEYPATTPDNPFVFHLYGFDEEPASLVLTEDNYLEFLRSLAQDWYQNLSADVRPRIPTYVQSALSSSMLLFLGFDLSSLDFRILFKGLVERINPERIDPKRMAVVQVDDATTLGELNKFITTDASKLKIRTYGGSVREYLTALCAALELN